MQHAVRNLLLLDASLQQSGDPTDDRRPLDEFVTKGIMVLLRQHLWRYQDVGIRTYDIELIRKPFNKALLLRLIARRRCWFEDEQGKRRDITLPVLLLLSFRRLRAAWVSRWGKGELLRRLQRFDRASSRSRRFGSGPPLYLRTDLVFGLQSGGSVTHIAGVLNELSRRPEGVQFVSTDKIPTVLDAVPTHVVGPDPRLWDVPESNALLMNLPLERQLRDAYSAPLPRFIYQRYGVNSIAGLMLAEGLGVPFVLEFNGSEVWVHRHWGVPLDDEAVTLRIELLNLRNADVVVVVSEALAEELRERGVESRRILVNPNGVDPNVYRPDLPTDALRRRLGVEQQMVIGFIGTFGPWHGAVVLVEAFARLLQQRPDFAGRVRLMMIGDGQQMTDVRRAVEGAGLDEAVVLTGRVPQTEGPEFLAACDILVSPHVPNPDGSAFFGSPTKLFEYMAMGRPIVASALEQIADVLTDEETALMVPPGDVDALALALARLVESPEMCRQLGANARDAALRRHTWERHTERILARLEDLVGG